MNDTLIECVPNISEGSNLDIINAIVDSARKNNGPDRLYG